MLVYIATSYSHSDPAVRLANFQRANKLAAWAMIRGHTVFSPISHSVPIAEYLPPELLLDHDWWMAMDLPILRLCDEMIVCPPDAALTSRGVAREVEEAKACNIPVRYLADEDLTLAPD